MDNQEFVPFLKKNWDEAGFKKPALIQEKVYAPISEGENLVGIAPTDYRYLIDWKQERLAKF